MALHASLTHGPEGPTLPHALRLAAEHPGGLTFLEDEQERRYPYATLAVEVERRGSQMLASGLAPGDRVGFVLPNNRDFVLSFLAALGVGVIPVPLYPPDSLAGLEAYLDRSARILAAARVTTVLSDRRTRGVLWPLLGRVESLKRLFTVEELSSHAATGEFDPDRVALDDVAFVQFTSGSTATPKGVVVTHRCLLANLHAILKHGLRINRDDHTVSWLPTYHDMGLIGFVLAPCWYAMPATFLQPYDFLRRPWSWLETITRVRGTISFAPNFAYALTTRRTPERILPTLDLASMKAFGCAAEPNHPATLRAFVERFAAAGLDPGALFPCYGMAEATLAVSFPPLGDGLRVDTIDADEYRVHGRVHSAKPSSGRKLSFVGCGRAMHDHQLRVVDPDGRALPDGVVGEIVFEGPSVARGYLDQPEATREVFKDGRLHTGDLGYLRRGELFVTGRKKDLIILHGRNYDPQSIEWEAAEVPGVRRGNVVAISQPGEATEELVVIAEVRDGENRDHLTRAIRERINTALMIQPREVVLLAAGQLPKTSSGKLQRQLTRQQFLGGTLGSNRLRRGRMASPLTLGRQLIRAAAARLRYAVLPKPFQAARGWVGRRLSSTANIDGGVE